MTIKSTKEMVLVQAPSPVSSKIPESKELPPGCFPDSYREELPRLPPKDGGKAAWLFLAAAFVVEVLTIGKSYI